MQPPFDERQRTAWGPTGQPPGQWQPDYRQTWQQMGADEASRRAATEPDPELLGLLPAVALAIIPAGLIALAVVAPLDTDSGAAEATVALAVFVVALALFGLLVRCDFALINIERLLRGRR